MSMYSNHSGKWLPCCVHHKAQSLTASLTKWGADSMSVSDYIHYIHGLSRSIQGLLRPLAIQVSFWPFQTLKQILILPNDIVLDKTEEVSGDQHSLRQVPTDIHWVNRQVTRAPSGTCSLSRMGICQLRHLLVHKVDLSTVIDANPHAQICCLLDS